MSSNINGINDEKYMKLGKIYHAAMSNKVGLNELDDYFAKSGLLTIDEQEQERLIQQELEEWLEDLDNIKFNKVIEDFAFTHMVDDNGNVVLIERGESDAI
ncbi:MAG: hypothetical protein WC656_01205 [Sulfurimonas sp.]|jgi:hypothetical protein